MSSTKELLIKIKDAAINNALPVSDIPISDIKDAVITEYDIALRSVGNNFSEDKQNYAAFIEKENNKLLEFCDNVNDNENNLEKIVLFLDMMINFLINLENNINGSAQKLPEDISPKDQYLYYINLAKEKYADNINQYYLCMENAYFHCKDNNIKSDLFNELKKIKANNSIDVKPVSIVIVSYNNIYLMQKCIESIRNNCCGLSYEIVVVDNASKDGVTEWLEKQEDIKLIKSEENLGFPKGCNVGIAHSKKENDIFLLNNDTRLCPNSLFWLRMGLYSEHSMGAAGAVTNYGGTIEHIELYYSSVEDYQRFGYVNNVYMENALEKSTFLSGFAMLLKRDVLDKTTLLDENLTPGYYDDDDISFQVLSLGYNLCVCHNSFIYHAGSQSFSKFKVDKLKDIYFKNSTYVSDKWGFSPAYDRPNTQITDVIKNDAKDSLNKLGVLEINARIAANYAHIKYLYPNLFYIGLEKNKKCIECSIKDANLILSDYFDFDYSKYKNSIDYIIANDASSFDINEKNELEKLFRLCLTAKGKIIWVDYNNSDLIQ